MSEHLHNVSRLRSATAESKPPVDELLATAHEYHVASNIWGLIRQMRDAEIALDRILTLERVDSFESHAWREFLAKLHEARVGGWDFGYALEKAVALVDKLDADTGELESQVRGGRSEVDDG